MSRPVGSGVRPPAERFWEKVNKTEWCWIWTAGNHKGYGRFYFDGHSRPAHQWAFIAAHGGIPTGLELDHLCRNPSCVRPSHLEPVSHRVNSLRSTSPTAINAAKVACVHGHPFDDANTYRDRNGRRRCRTCNRINVARIKARKKAAT